MNRKMKREMKKGFITKTKGVLAGILAINTIGAVTAAAIGEKIADAVKADTIANTVGKNKVSIDGVSISLDQELNDNGDGTYNLSLTTSSNLSYEDMSVKATKIAYGYFEAEKSGSYMLEIWGGNGANGQNTFYSHGGKGGKGAHVYAVADLQAGDILFYTIGGNGQQTLSNDTGGGANGDGGDHGDTGNYYVGGGGGYTAVYKFNKSNGDANTFRSNYLDASGNLTKTQLDESDRTSKYILIAGGGGGGGAGNGPSLTDWAIRTPDGGNAGEFTSPHGHLPSGDYAVGGTFYAGSNGFSSGKRQDFVGKGGSDRPGEVNSTFIEWFSGKKPNDWEGTNNAKYPGGSGGAGNLRGGAGGAGYAGGSGGIMAGLLVGTDVGGGGGGSSFIADSLYAPDETQQQYVSNHNTSTTGGAVYVSYMPGSENLEYLNHLTVDGEISKYFDITDVSAHDSDGAIVPVSLNGNKFTATGVKATAASSSAPGKSTKIEITVKPIAGFMGGNDVPFFVGESLKYGYVKQSVPGSVNMPTVERCSYVNVPYAFTLETHSYTKSGSEEEPNTELKGGDLYVDNDYIGAKTAEATKIGYDFIDEISPYVIQSDGATYGKDETLSLSESKEFEISYTVTPKAGSKAVVGEKLARKTYKKSAKVTIVPISKNSLNGNEMVYQRTLNYNPSTEIYDLTFNVKTQASIFVPASGDNVKFEHASGTSGSYTITQSGYYYAQLWGGIGGNGGNSLFSGRGPGTRGYITGLFYFEAGEVINYVLANNGANGASGTLTRGGQRGEGGKATVVSSGTTEIIAAAGSGGGGGGIYTGNIAEVGRDVNNSIYTTTFSTTGQDGVYGQPLESRDFAETQTTGGWAGKNYRNLSHFSDQPIPTTTELSGFSVDDYTNTSGGAFYLSFVGYQNDSLTGYSVVADFTDDFELVNAATSGTKSATINNEEVTNIVPELSVSGENFLADFSVIYTLKASDSCLGGVDIKLLDALTLAQDDIDLVPGNDEIKVKDPAVQESEEDYPTDYANVKINESLLDTFNLSTNSVNYIQGREVIDTSVLYEASNSFVPIDNLVVKEASEGLEATVTPNQTTDYQVTYGIKSSHDAEKAVVGPTIEPLVLSSSARVNVYHEVHYNLTNVSVDAPTANVELVDGTSETIYSFIPGENYVATLTPGVGMELPMENIEVTIDGVNYASFNLVESGENSFELTIPANALKNDSNVVVSAIAKERTFKLHYLVAIDETGFSTQDFVTELKAGTTGADLDTAIDELLAKFNPEPIEGYTFTIEFPDGDRSTFTEMPPYDCWINGTYQPNPHTLTVNFVDEEGNVLAEPYTEPNEDCGCYNNKVVDVLSKEIPNYAPIVVKDVTDPAHPTEPGYNPARIQFNMPDNDVVLNVVYTSTLGKTIINYQCKDTDIIVPDTKIYTGTVGNPYSIDIPSIPGYVGEYDVTPIGTITAEGESLLVTYSPISYTIKFNSAIPEGGYTEFEDRTAFYGHEIGFTGESYEESTFLPLPTPVRVGYEFLGWYYNGSKVDGLSVFNKTTEITLTAMWKKTVTEVDDENTHIRLTPDTFEYDGEEHKPDVQVVVNNKILTEGVDYSLAYSLDCVSYGEKEVKISFFGDYSGSLTETYVIEPKNIPSDKLTVEDISENTYTYTGDEITPKPAVSYVNASEETVTLVEGTDIEYEYVNNIESGKAKVIVHFIGDYAATPDVEREFTISPRDIKDDAVISVTGITSPVEYTGEAIEPTNLVVTFTDADGTTTLKEGTDYIIVYGENTDVGTGTVTIKFINNYAATPDEVKTFNILPQTLDPSKLDNTGIDPEGYVYTGEEIKPAPIVITYDGETLQEGVDYELEYVDNVHVDGDGNDPRIVVHFKGNYEGNDDYEIPFDISPKSIEDPTDPSNPHGLNVEPLPTSTDPIVIHDDGTPVEPEDLLPISITDKDTGDELTYGEDFIIVIDDEDEGTAHIEFIGDYEGTDNIDLFFDAKTPIVDPIGDQNYTGEEIKPVVHVTFDGEDLVEGVDYEVTYETNKETGTGTVIVTYINDFADIVPNPDTYTFNIVQTTIDPSKLLIGTIDPVTYDGTQHTPKPTVTYNGVTLTEGVDFEYSYGENVHAGDGAGKVVITFKGGFTSTKDATVYFDILGKKVEDPTNPDTGLIIEPLPDDSDPMEIPNNGKDPIEFEEIVITDQVTGEELRNPEDFTLVDDGNGDGHIEFHGDYENTPDVPFKYEITDPEIDTVIEDQPYTGEPIEPEITVKFGDDVLEEGVDYIVRYEDNDEVGEGKVIVEFIGDYEGCESQEITFDIVPTEINEDLLDVAEVEDHVYTGSQIKPTPVVKYNDVTLVEGKDFVYSYGENVHAGEDAGSVIITFIGGFEGDDVTKTFNITPKQISNPDDPETGLDIDPRPTEQEPIVVLDKGDGSDPDLMPIEIIDKQTGETLTNPEDFEIVLDDEEGHAHIEFKGDYEGTPDIPLYYEVQEIKVNIPTQPYSGEEVKPHPEITFAGETLTEGEDYVVYYSNNNQPGTATAIIQFIGEYSDVATRTVEFNIKGTRLDNSATTADGRSTVIIINEEGFDPDISVSAVLREEVPDEVKNQANLGGRFYGTYGDYEIKLLDKDGNEVQPSDIKEGTVLTLMIQLPEELQGRDVKLVHYHSADDITLIVKGDEAGIGTYIITEEGYLVTQINKFSDFSIIYEETCLAHWFMITAAVLNILLIAAIIIMGKKQHKVVGIATIVGLAVMSGVGAIFAHCTICWIALGINGALLLFDILFFAMWKGKDEPQAQPQVVQAQPQVVYVQAPAQAAAPVAQEAAPAPVAAPAPQLSLSQSIAKAAVIENEGLFVTKQIVAQYLSDNYADSVSLNRKPNYTSTNLPLADTHYVKVSEEKKLCFIYVYELNDNKSFFIVRTRKDIFEAIKAKHPVTELSAFPKAQDELMWYSVMFDSSYKSLEDVYEVIDMVLNGFVVEKKAPAPAPVEPEAELSLHDQMEKAAAVVAEVKVNKEVVANYLTETYKDAVIVNRKANYTKTGLPLADTHYVKLEKNVCVMYVYELNDGKSFLIVKTSSDVFNQIKAKHAMTSVSAFPHTNDGGKWYSVMFDESYKSMDDVYEVIDLVINSYLNGKPVEAAPEVELSLHDQMEKAAAMKVELKVNKEMVANYLLDAYKDSTIVNRKPNYTKTGLPLADTHYVLLGEDKKACFMYVYELNDGNAFAIVKTSEEIYKAIKAKHASSAPSAFPHTNDGGKWYSVMFDASFESEADVHEVIDMVINGFDKNPAPVKEEPKPVEVKEEPAPVVEEADEAGINFMYKFSFSARLIRAGAERQDFYNEIKNEFLSYKKVNSKISWGHELFKLGRIKLGQMKVKGKTLCVYLPLDPKKYDQERLWFKETGDDEFPMMMQVKSDRAVKYVKELIVDVMANNEIPHMDNYEAVDYRLPEMSIEEMLKAEPPLAKLVEGAVMPQAEEKAPVEAKKVEEPAPALVVEEPALDEDGIDYKYKFSFSARLIRAGMDRQEFYNAVKNEFLSYKKVNSKISWGHELFKLGRIKLGQMKVKGKTLCVYLPLDPASHDMDRLHFKETGKEEFPIMMKVTSDRAVKYVAELIAEVMAANELPRLEDYEAVDYKLPEMSIEEMLKADPPLAKENDSTVSFGK